MTSALLTLIQDNSGSTIWDAIRAIAPTLTSAGILALLALNWRLRDAVRDLIREVGLDGKNGLKKAKADHDERISALERWKIQEDAIDATEKELMKDVGRDPERLRDRLHDTEERMIPDGYRYKHKEE